MVNMELALKRKIPLLFLAACVFFAVVLSETLSTRDHDCIGADCTICLLIKAVDNFLKTLKFTGFMFNVFLLLLACVIKRFTGFNAYRLSPVALKVRFNT